eukprot:TRINITY_DN8490_c0_g1_i1.p1 TRINITY_DN8490_c0_g1~~TRINITY_DN8490_c0_g1_i1.p1  ORF type:complete len:197 (-),score=42.89 TRINITY_DN8490_c0_g1_i1:190-780(-)
MDNKDVDPNYDEDIARAIALSLAEESNEPTTLTNPTQNASNPTSTTENTTPSSSSSSSLLVDFATQSLIQALSSREDEVRVAMLVRTDLKMGVGKMCAQCGHSAVGIYSLMESSSNPIWKDWFLRWENGGAAKIALKCPDVETMHRLEQQARSLGLPTCTIQDLGRTQIPSGSVTVCAIAGPKSILDTVTGKLKLL